jgi:hypothetical protein
MWQTNLPCSVSNWHSNSYCVPKCLSIVCAFVNQKLQGRLRTDILFIGCSSVKDHTACMILQFYYLCMCILSAHVLVCSLLSVLQFWNVQWAKFFEFVLKVDSFHWCSYTFWFCQQFCCRSFSRATKLQFQS